MNGVRVERERGGFGILIWTSLHYFLTMLPTNTTGEKENTLPSYLLAPSGLQIFKLIV